MNNPPSPPEWPPSCWLLRSLCWFLDGQWSKALIPLQPLFTLPYHLRWLFSGLPADRRG